MFMGMSNLYLFLREHPSIILKKTNKQTNKQTTKKRTDRNNTLEQNQSYMMDEGNSSLYKSLFCKLLKKYLNENI
jgi:hypothetical protein